MSQLPTTDSSPKMQITSQKFTTGTAIFLELSTKPHTNAQLSAKSNGDSKLLTWGMQRQTLPPTLQPSMARWRRSGTGRRGDRPAWRQPRGTRLLQHLSGHLPTCAWARRVVEEKKSTGGKCSEHFRFATG
jgi:hypothetical protein